MVLCQTRQNCMLFIHLTIYYTKHFYSLLFIQTGIFLYFDISCCYYNSLHSLFLKTAKENTRQRSIMIIIKRIFRIVVFIVQMDHRVKIKESEQRAKYLDLPRELRKLWNMRMMRIPVVSGALGTMPKFGKRTGRVENWRTNRDHPDNYSFEIGPNTEKTPEDLKRPYVTRSPLKGHQLMLAWKTR